MSYKVISSKGNFNVGDLAFYFPIDSVIPDYWVEAFGIGSYYNKKLSAAKLRGIFSEGLLIPLNDPIIVAHEGYLQNLSRLGVMHYDTPTQLLGCDFSNFFQTTKFKYPLPTSMGGDAEGVIGRYKFPAPENYKRYSHVLVPGEEIVVFEKGHGSNFTVLHKHDEFSVGSHNYFWKLQSSNNVGNVWVRTFNLLPKAYFDNIGHNVQIFGEVLGVQDLKYGCTNGALDYFVFAIKVNDKFLDLKDFINTSHILGLKTAPILYIGPYTDEVVNQWNNADSKLANHMMEGVVINPTIERTDMEIGRVCLKLLSDKYLLRKNGTELH